MQEETAEDEMILLPFHCFFCRMRGAFLDVVGLPLSLPYSGRRGRGQLLPVCLVGETSHRLAFGSLFLDSHIHILMSFADRLLSRSPVLGLAGPGHPNLQRADHVGEKQAPQSRVFHRTWQGLRGLGWGSGRDQSPWGFGKVNSLSFPGHIEAQGVKEKAGHSRGEPRSQEVPRRGSDWLVRAECDRWTWVPSMYEASLTVSASRADGALEGLEEASRSETPKGSF